MKNSIQALINSHAGLLRAANLQRKTEPNHTVHALEIEIELARNIKPPAIRSVRDAEDKSIEWETAAHLLAKSIQNPADTKTAWLAVMAYVKVNGSTTPKV